MNEFKRYYANSETTIDLAYVVAVTVIKQVRSKGYAYEVAFKSGGKLKCSGTGLRAQFNEYKGIVDDKVEIKE